MEKIELTVDEAQNLFKKSKATIYNWINAGKLPYKDTEKGRVLLLTADQVESMKYNLLSKSNNLEQVESKLDDNFLLSRILEMNETLQNKMIEYNEKLLYYSEQVGQVKFLTDNNKFYQDEYFKLKYEIDSKLEQIRKLELELETLRKLNNDLQDENINLKKETESKNIPWWKLKK